MLVHLAVAALFYSFCSCYVAGVSQVSGSVPTATVTAGTVVSQVSQIQGNALSQIPNNAPAATVAALVSLIQGNVVSQISNSAPTATVGSGTVVPSLVSQISGNVPLIPLNAPLLRAAVSVSVTVPTAIITVTTAISSVSQISGNTPSAIGVSGSVITVASQISSNLPQISVSPPIIRAAQQISGSVSQISSSVIANSFSTVSRASQPSGSTVGSSIPAGTVASSLAPASGKAPTATIDVGTVIGTTTTLPSSTVTVNKFLGIPFAVTPPERFFPPQPVGNFSQPLQATAWGPACIQQFVYPEPARTFTELVFGGTPSPMESEDCLYLNVYAPATPTTGKAVMFWIYGGSLEFGNAGQDAYDGTSFAANQDVIIVSANYRINVFGFSNSPEIPITERNAGFLDQRLALAWVQRNIAAFGGDPNRVTIFGQSAGAASVDRLVTTLPNNPPFAAAITESGQASVSPDPSTAGPTSWATLVKALNCSLATSQLACVQAADAMTIKSIIEHAALSFSPVTDNVTQLATPLLTARMARQIANVPYMTGTNGQEGRVFQVEAAGNASAYAEFLSATFPEGAAMQQAVEVAYQVGQGNLQNYYDAASQIFTEYIFQCPAYYVSRTSAAAGVPTWRYYYNATIPNIQPQIPFIPQLEAFHSSEIPLVFGTFPITGVTAQEFALSNYMQTAWATFAKNPMGGPGWRPLDSTGFDVACLGCNGSSNVVIVSESSLDYRCGLYKPIYAAVDAPAF